jgi:two-component system, sensor histidine kinase LadS
MRYLSFVALGLALMLAMVPAAADSPRITRTLLIEAPADFAPQDEAALQRLRSFQASPVVSLDDPSPGVGKTTWYKLELEQGTHYHPEGEVLRIIAAAHDRVEGLLIENGRLLSRTVAGFTIPATERQHHATHLVVPLEGWRTARAEVYISINTGALIPLRPAILSERDLRIESDTALVVSFSYVGGVVVLLLIQGAMYLHFRDRAARDYMLVSLGFLLLLLTQNGYFDLIWAGHLGSFHLGDWRHHMRLVNCIVGLMAFGSFFEFSAVEPRMHRFLRGSTIGLTLLLAATFTLPINVVQKLVSFAQLYAVAAVLAACVTALRCRLIGSVLITVGWSGILLVTAYLNLVRFGVVPGWLDTPNLPVAAVMWELLFNTLGLTYKFKRLGEIRHQKELRDLEVAGLERMVRVLCHDLSTPLATIGMTTDLLQLNREAGRPVDLDATTGRLQHAVKSIKEIVDSTRQVEALKLNGGNLPREPVDLCTVFHDAERMVQEKLSRKRITLRKTDWPEDAIVLAEPRMLRLSVIANALSNAVKFSSSGGTIDVSLRREGGAMVLRIRDHGVGIPREMREAFERSGRIQSRPGTMNEEGTGFGMTLMRDFTKAMRGEFRLESRTAEESATDHGTTVEIRLPVAVTADLTTP